MKGDVPAPHNYMLKTPWRGQLSLQALTSIPESVFLLGNSYCSEATMLHLTELGHSHLIPLSMKLTGTFKQNLVKS